MDGATRNLLIKMSRNGGSLFAGVDATAEADDPVVDRAISRGLIAIRADSWATGDFYVLTGKGWSAIGQKPPSDAVEPSWRDLIMPAKILLAIAAVGLAFQAIAGVGI